jgi:pimeloyl-ACP methyl ester carboxylesterase
MLPGAMHGAWCFAEHWMPYFAAHGIESWALSYRGHGLSEGSYARASLEDYLDDVREVLCSFPVRPILVGHSMGGFLIQHLLAANDYPAAVLVATVPHRGMPLPVLLGNSIRHPLRFARMLATRDMRPFFDTPAMVRTGLFTGAISEAELVRHFERFDGESLRVFMELGPFGRVPPRRRHRTPMLTIAGSEDVSQTPARLRRTASVIGSEYQTLEGSGHDVMLDVRWREGAEMIRKWLALRGMVS